MPKVANIYQLSTIFAFFLLSFLIFLFISFIIFLLTTYETILLTKRDVQDRLRVSDVTLEKYMREGAFPHAFKLSDGPRSPWRIPESDVIEFMERRKQRSNVKPVCGVEQSGSSSVS